MKQNVNELSDLVEQNNLFDIVGNELKKAGKFLYQTVRQSPDADILLAGVIASYFVPELESARPIMAFFTAKQYLYGHITYHLTNILLKSKNHEVTRETFERAFPWWNPMRLGGCCYCGSRYAFKQYEKELHHDKAPDPSSI